MLHYNITRKYCPKLVAMATSLEESEKLARIDNVRANTLNNDDNN